MTMEAAANLSAIAFNDRGGSHLDVLVVAYDFDFVFYCAFRKCHVYLLWRGTVRPLGVGL